MSITKRAWVVNRMMDTNNNENNSYDKNALLVYTPIRENMSFRIKNKKVQSLFCLNSSPSTIQKKNKKSRLCSKKTICSNNPNAWSVPLSLAVAPLKVAALWWPRFPSRTSRVPLSSPKVDANTLSFSCTNC